MRYRTRQSLIIAIAVILTLAVGSTAVATGSQEAAAPQTLRFSVYQPHFSQSWLGTDIYPIMMERFESYVGMTVEIEWEELAFGDFLERRNLYLAAGDFHDAFTTALTESAVQEAGDNGLIVDLMQYEQHMPYFVENHLNTEVNRRTAINADGRMYSFPSIVIQSNTGTQHGWAYRYDVFSEHGIALPTSMNEFLAAARQLKQIYPASYPITGLPGTSAGMNILSQLLVHNRTNSRIYYDGAAYRFGPTEDSGRIREVLQFLNTAYREGLLDPEFVSHTTQQLYVKMLDGTSFMSPAFWSLEVEQHLNNNEQFRVEWVIPKRPTNFRGEQGWKMESGVVGSVLATHLSLAVSARSPNRELVIKFLDYQHNPEIVELGNWGIEGETFRRVENGLRRFVPAIADAAPGDRQKIFEQWGLYPALSVRPGIMWFPQDRDAVTAFNESPVWDGGNVRRENYWEFTSRAEGPDSIFPDAPGYRMPVSFSSTQRDFITDNMTPIHTLVDEAYAQFIVGDRPLSEYNAFVESLSRIGNWQAVRDMYNEQVR